MRDVDITTESVGYARELRALYRAAERRAVRFRLLVEMGRDLGSISETDELLRLALARVITFSSYDTGAVFLQSTEGTLTLRARYSITASKTEIPLPQEVFEQAAAALSQGRIVHATLHDRDPALPQALSNHTIYLPLIPLDGQPLGIIWLSGASPGAEPDSDDLDALELLAAQIAAALRSAQLHEEKDKLVHRLSEREHQLAALVSQLIRAQEEERHRVAYELHDGLAQMIVGVLQQIHILSDRYHPRALPARNALRRALDMGQATVSEARRVIAGLRPTVLDAFGLGRALQQEIKLLEADGWVVTFDEALGQDRLPPAIETALFRIAQEALNNVRKHAGVSEVCLTIRRLDTMVELIVQDHGCGFDLQAGMTHEPGMQVGLSSIQERVRLFDGQWHLESRIGHGTRLEVRLPLAAAHEGA